MWHRSIPFGSRSTLEWVFLLRSCSPCQQIPTRSVRAHKKAPDFGGLMIAW